MCRWLSNVKMSLKKVVVDMFYDVASPYAWIGFEAITRHNHKWKSMDLNLQPILLGAILRENNAQPPTPNRAKFSKVELRLLASYHQVPFNRPKNFQHVLFEKGTLQPQRLLTAVKKYHPSALEQVSRELYLRIWSKDLDATKPENLTVACTNAGLTSDQSETLISAIKTDQIKQKLKDTTQNALQQGVFGTPTFIAHIQPEPVLLFGFDKLFLLAHLLDENWHGALNELNQAKL